MTAQILERTGKKEFAYALKELRKAKADLHNQVGRPFAEVAVELGLMKPSRTRRP